MAKKTTDEISPMEQEILLLEKKKVKALERIANSVDALTIWFEEIDKKSWDERIQFYLHEWHSIRDSESYEKIQPFIEFMIDRMYSTNYNKTQ